MPFKEVNAQEEKRKHEELLQRSPEARRAHELFQREIALKEAIIKMRKKEKLTQKQLSDRTGLSQQAISRLENGVGNANISTLMRYLNGMGYRLTITK